MSQPATRNRNVISVVVGALVVVAAVLGYQLYQARHTSGIELSIGHGSITVETK